jgi:hypothetical protein
LTIGILRARGKGVFDCEQPTLTSARHRTKKRNKLRARIATAPAAGGVRRRHAQELDYGQL